MQIQNDVVSQQIDWPTEFDRFAVGEGYPRRYDEVLIDTKLHLAIFELVNSAIELKSSLTVLDLACGSGLGGEPFIQRGCSVMGMDFSREMLALAKKRGYSHVQEVDLKSITSPLEEVFDIVLAIGVAEDYVPLNKLLDLVEQTMHHGGIIVVSCPIEANGEETFFSRGLSIANRAKFDFKARGVVSQKLDLFVAKKSG